MNLIGAGTIVESIMGGLDSLFTSDEERAAAELKLVALLAQPHMLQAMTNIEEAKHPSVFVSGWRPALGWLCVSCLGYAWIIRDFIVIGLHMSEDTKDIVLPVIDSSELMTLVLALLGLGGIRMYEKIKGVVRN